MDPWTNEYKQWINEFHLLTQIHGLKKKKYKSPNYLNIGTKVK